MQFISSVNDVQCKFKKKKSQKRHAWNGYSAADNHELETNDVYNLLHPHPHIRHLLPDTHNTLHHCRSSLDTRIAY